MSLSLDVTHFNDFFNRAFPAKNWVLSGSFAIDCWCAILDIPTLNALPNNIDILYSQNTPITISTIGNYTRRQNSPHTSVTFENPEFTPINLTMSRNTIKYYETEGMKIISPISLLSWYEDEPEMHQVKIQLLREIISRTQNFEFKYIYSKELRRLEEEDTASKRRLLTV